MAYSNVVELAESTIIFYEDEDNDFRCELPIRIIFVNDDYSSVQIRRALNIDSRAFELSSLHYYGAFERNVRKNLNKLKSIRLKITYVMYY